MEGSGLVDFVFSSCLPSSGHCGLKGFGTAHGQFLGPVLLYSLLLRTCPFLSLPPCLSGTSAVGHFGVDLTLCSSLSA